MKTRFGLFISAFTLLLGTPAGALDEAASTPLRPGPNDRAAALYRIALDRVALDRAAPERIAAAEPAAPIAPATPAAAIAATDQAFVDAAVVAGSTEIAAAQLALQLATDPDVKDFARTMIADHGKLAGELARTAAAQGVTPAPGGTDAAVMAKLKALKGRDFDRSYAEVVLRSHEEAVELFGRQSQSGSNASLRALADYALPTLRHHLVMARKLVTDGQTAR
ncbi:DUF4142 domain-containing protein [Chitinimonas koreensis]|uniref:DUF4142 domain-containing protein n=1 Tax=Chitinimonas koreensis TaxID=356302 RepID=UPI0003FA6DFB|nr:DUF4142 domain-containing protein [Chitinimonas koreensis]QNM98112.1 DUF4142 domain-containing protein [Chitinimonas koreensis]